MCQIAAIDQAFSYMKGLIAEEFIQKQYSQITTLASRIAEIVSTHMWDTHSLVSLQLHSWKERIHAHFIHMVTTIISFSILESQLFSDVQIAQAEAEALTFFETKNEVFTYEKQNLDCDDGILLDAIRLRHKSTRVRTQKVVIYFLKNASLWAKEHKLLATLCEKDSQDILCCNYRGTGKSSGFAANANFLIEDGLKVVQSLTTKGVSPKNITLCGYSFGYRIASVVANKLENEGILVQLIGNPPKKSIPDSVRESFPCFSNEVGSLVERFGW
jgi:hypothetical protein